MPFKRVDLDRMLRLIDRTWREWMRRLLLGPARVPVLVPARRTRQLPARK